MATSRKNEGSKREPVQRFQAYTGSGNVQVAVWKKEDGDRPVYSVSLQRSYRTDGEWKKSQTLFPQDLLVAARLLQQAWDWIEDQG